MAQKGYQEEVLDEVANWGYYDGEFHRENLRLGFHDTLGKYYEDTDLSAGFNTINSDQVPAGEVWTITQVAIRYKGTSPTNIFVVARPQATDVVIISVESPTNNVWYYEQVNVVLKPGEVLAGRVNGATAHDTLQYEFGGYTTDISS